MNIARQLTEAIVVALATAVLVTGTTGRAGAQDLPPAADLAAAHRAAVGGADVLAGHTAMYSAGTLSMPASGVSGRFELWTARPARRAIRVTLQGIGEIRSGYTDDIAWSINPMQGPRLLTGAEAAQAADEAIFGASLRSSGIASMTTVEAASFGGRDCFKVRVQWESGRETFDCYSAETGLRIAAVVMQASSMGTMETVTLYDDYREFEGFLIPTRWTVTVPATGMQQVIEIQNVEFDAVPDSAFAIPDPIRSLVAAAHAEHSGR